MRRVARKAVPKAPQPVEDLEDVSPMESDPPEDVPAPQRFRTVDWGTWHEHYVMEEELAAVARYGHTIMASESGRIDDIHIQPINFGELRTTPTSFRSKNRSVGKNRQSKT